MVVPFYASVSALRPIVMFSLKFMGENLFDAKFLPLSCHKILMPTFLSSQNNDSVKVRVVFREAENLISVQGSNFNYVTELNVKKRFGTKLVLYIHN